MTIYQPKLRIQPVQNLIPNISWVKVCTAAFLFICVFTQTSYSQQRQNLNLRNSVRKINLKKIIIEGNRTVDEGRIRSTLGLEENSELLPLVLRDKVRESIKDLYSLGWFSNISVEIEYPDSVDGAFLIFNVEELPTLGTSTIKGYDEIDEDEIRDVMELIDGQVFSKSSIQREKQRILDLYHEEGFFLTKINVVQKEDSESGLINVEFQINEGKKVKVRSINFVGNKKVKSKHLRKSMATEVKSWFFGIGGEFKEEEFRSSKDSIVNYFQQHGFLDASVISHSITYTDDYKYMDIEIIVDEGTEYRFGTVTFIHNDIVYEKALHQQMLLKKGEIVNIQKFDASKYQIETVYRDIGHLFVQVQEEKKYDESTLSVVYKIKEGNIAHINKVHIRGNTKTKDKVVRRELKIFPGDIFSQSLVMRSTREVMQLNYFDMVNPNFEPIGNDNVDLVFDIQEKEAGTGTFSAGAAYSARDQLVGTLGLQIPNFLGNGQRADLNVEWGQRKQLYSIGFTEPWFLDTPTLLGGNVFWSRTQNFNYVESLNDLPEPFGSKFFKRIGFSIKLGRRLTWPDDYWSAFSRYSLTSNKNGREKDPSLLLQESGLESSININLVRDDKDLPIFPTDGSRYSFIYEKFGGVMGGDFDYSKWETKINWWFPTIKKLTLGIETQLGIITGNKIQKWDLYQMGGVFWDLTGS